MPIVLPKRRTGYALRRLGAGSADLHLLADRRSARNPGGDRPSVMETRDVSCYRMKMPNLTTRHRNYTHIPQMKYFLQTFLDLNPLNVHYSPYAR